MTEKIKNRKSKRGGAGIITENFIYNCDLIKKKTRMEISKLVMFRRTFYENCQS
jgi:hypothetical protein